jgi:hypothetical protein
MARKSEDRTDLYLWTTDDEPVSSMRVRLEAEYNNSRPEYVHEKAEYEFWMSLTDDEAGAGCSVYDIGTKVGSAVNAARVPDWTFSSPEMVERRCGMLLEHL